MSTVVLEQPSASPPPQEPAAARSDTLAQSVVLMLGLIVAQRLIGFVRTVLFCRWLDPIELGEWDMALAFFSLAAPLAVMGVSGSFGRYVEHFRQARQLQSFIRKVTLFTGVALVIWSSVLLLRPDWVSRHFWPARPAGFDPSPGRGAGGGCSLELRQRSAQRLAEVSRLVGRSVGARAGLCGLWRAAGVGLAADGLCRGGRVRGGDVAGRGGGRHAAIQTLARPARMAASGCRRGRSSSGSPRSPPGCG